MADAVLAARSVTGGIVVVSVRGEIDLANVRQFRDTLATHFHNRAATIVVCDLSQVEFLACSGLSVLLDAQATLAARGAALRVVASSAAVLRPLRVTGLLSELTVNPDLATALG